MTPQTLRRCSSELLSRAAESSGVTFVEGCRVQHCPFRRACVVKQSKSVFAKPPFPF